MVTSIERRVVPEIHTGTNPIKTAVVELGWNICHLKRSIDQKRAIDPDAENWLALFYDAVHTVPNEFSLNGEVPVLKDRRASGFWFSVYSFEVSGRSYVLKIGHEYSPVFGPFDPSSKDFFQAYKEKLQKQRETYPSYLPYLIPIQEVAFLDNGKRTATVVVQPDVPHGEKFADFRRLSHTHQDRILREYDTLIALNRNMRRRTGLVPDLLFEHFLNGTHNLVIGQTPDGSHLVLLDDDSIDTTRNTPLLNLAAKFAATAWLAYERARFQTIQRRNGNGHA